MKYLIAGEHRNYFGQHKLIEFEGLLKPDQIEKLKNIEIKNQRDAWRRSTEIKKIVTNRTLAKIASDLMDIKPLRLGYDQYFENQPFNHVTLKDVSSYQEVTCGLFLCIRKEENIDSLILPSEVGRGVYFSPDLKIHFPELNHNSYLMIVFTPATTVYIKNRKDSLNHWLKEYGYNFGDKLKDELNPIVYR